MADLITVTARDANQRFSELLGAVEREGKGFLVTKRGRPVARIVPVADADEVLARRRAALADLFATARPLGVGSWTRDELHERR